MGLDVWFREDVTRILVALESAGANHGPEYLKALHDVALAFGVAARLQPRSDRKKVQIVDSFARQVDAVDWR